PLHIYCGFQFSVFMGFPEDQIKWTQAVQYAITQKQEPRKEPKSDTVAWYQDLEKSQKAMLLNLERIWFGTVTSLNRTTLLPEEGAEAIVEHNFLVGLMAEED
ncbi:hypothetical protein STEG23_036678, partial [Scotinomys teguina]